MKVAVVTGASSGLGKEFARQIADKEKLEEIWLIARRRENLEQLAEELPVRARVIPMDLTKEEEYAKYRAALQQADAQVMLLINCSGFGKFGRYGKVSEQDSLDMIDLNCRALVQMTLATLPYFSSGGRILQISSTSSFQPLPRLNIYAATKAFVLHYSRALHQELRPKGITVTAVCPGWMKTDFLKVAALHTGDQAVHNFFFVTNPQKVVAKALRDSAKGKEISMYGVGNHIHRVAAKLLPHKLIMRVWELSQQ